MRPGTCRLGRNARRGGREERELQRSPALLTASTPSLCVRSASSAPMARMRDAASWRSRVPVRISASTASALRMETIGRTRRARGHPSCRRMPFLTTRTNPWASKAMRNPRDTRSLISSSGTSPRREAPRTAIGARHSPTSPARKHPDVESTRIVRWSGSAEGYSIRRQVDSGSFGSGDRDAQGPQLVEDP